MEPNPYEAPKDGNRSNPKSLAPWAMPHGLLVLGFIAVLLAIVLADVVFVLIRQTVSPLP